MSNQSVSLAVWAAFVLCLPVAGCGAGGEQSAAAALPVAAQQRSASSVSYVLDIQPYEESISYSLVGGRPAFAYLSDGSHLFSFVRAANASGSVWNPPIKVDVAPIPKHSIKLRVVNGNPAIVYSEAGGDANNIHYCRASDSSGTQWGPDLVIDSFFPVHTAPSGYSEPDFAVVDGQAAVVYLADNGEQAPNGCLVYLHATDAAGTAWTPGELVDGTDDSGRWSSLAEVNGRPAVAYKVGLHLAYKRALNAGGSSWPPPTPLYALPSGSFDCAVDLKVIAGNPALAFRSETLRFKRSTDINGSNWSNSVQLDTGMAAGGQNVSLAMLGGKPAVCYIHYPGKELRCVKADWPDGSTWGDPVTVVSHVNLGERCSLGSLFSLNGNGAPIVGYMKGSKVMATLGF